MLPPMSANRDRHFRRGFQGVSPRPVHIGLAAAHPHCIERSRNWSPHQLGYAALRGRALCWKNAPFSLSHMDDTSCRRTDYFLHAADSSTWVVNSIFRILDESATWHATPFSTSFGL
jgi:hypothetical protein